MADHLKFQGYMNVTSKVLDDAFAGSGVNPRQRLLSASINYTKGGIDCATVEFVDPDGRIAKAIRTGERDGEEVVQLYVTDLEASVPVPVRSLKGFSRIALKASEERRVTFAINPYDLSLLDKDNQRVVEPGEFSIAVGGKQPGIEGAATTQTLEANVLVNEIAYLE